MINADDYYGKEAFVKLHDFLVDYTPEKANQFCMAGFIEYSCAVTPQVRQTGNRLSGLAGTAYASLLT